MIGRLRCPRGVSCGARALHTATTASAPSATTNRSVLPATMRSVLVDIRGALAPPARDGPIHGKTSW